ncbi:hypothetical protein BD770DRAFT_329485 [Pilaira anomala]|nr:hypothetical protein BD770DRAFT_329485 [Pilaira anomala]
MHTSYISESHQQTIVPLLIKDFLETPFPFHSLEAYEPTCSTIVDILDQCSSIKMKLLYNLWSYDNRNIHWSNRSLEIKNHDSTVLKQATLDDLPLIVEWTQGFFQDIEDNSTRRLTMDIDHLSTTEITKGHVYILYYEGIPVSMSRKRRSLKDGCSLSFVYTPKHLRQKGYGAVCVAMCTDLFLKKYKYVTLFVMGHVNPIKNMYTGVGYQLVGKVGRYQTVELLNK